MLPTREIPGRYELVDEEPAERALVDEAQFRPGVGEADADVQVPFVRRGGGAHQQLPTHAEVAEQALVRVGQRQPQVLPAPSCSAEAVPTQALRKVTAEMAANRSGMTHLNVSDDAPGHPFREAGADGLDLWKFGQCSGPRGLVGSGVAGPGPQQPIRGCRRGLLGLFLVAPGACREQLATDAGL